MSVSRYFGLPGCGKTTTLTMLAKNGQASGRYRFVCGNVNLSLHGYVYVPFECFGTYDLSDTLYLIDEAMVEAGDRDYKNFDKCKLEAFVMHRHYNMDIVLFSQEADGIDKKIRSITDRMYYVKKGFFTGKWISSIYRIPYKILWPDAKTAGENVGRIVMGYAKPNIFCRLFAQRLYRPRYYKYFDSWERKLLPPLPQQLQPFQDPGYHKPIFRPWLHKTVILLRSLCWCPNLYSNIFRLPIMNIYRYDTMFWESSAVPALFSYKIYTPKVSNFWGVYHLPSVCFIR